MVRRMKNTPDRDAVEIVETVGYGRSLRARVAFAAGDVIAPLTGSVTDRPDRYSIQVGADEHVEPGTPMKYLDHACDPSTYIDTDAKTCVALRDIAPGEALTMGYPATEWQMDAPFECRCGAKGCLGRVTGAAELSGSALAAFRVAPHIEAARAAAAKA